MFALKISIIWLYLTSQLMMVSGKENEKMDPHAGVNNGDDLSLKNSDHDFQETDTSSADERSTHGSPKEHIRRKRHTISRRWPTTTIPYFLHFEKHITKVQRQKLRRAMDIWESVTCITFKKVRRCTVDDVCLKITDGHNMCATDIGFIRPIPLRKMRLDVKKETGCFRMRTLVHELGHALGLIHEHSRSDRDEYITLHQNHLQDEFAHNFKIRKTEYLDIPYDYVSVMHYGEHHFTKDGRITIETKDRSYQSQIGKQSRPSFRDFKKINLMYKCSENCVRSDCPGEGYQGNDCKCKCPAEDGRDTVLCSDNEATTRPTKKTTQFVPKSDCICMCDCTKRHGRRFKSLTHTCHARLYSPASVDLSCSCPQKRKWHCNCSLDCQ